jgi:hypothetical protein
MVGVVCVGVVGVVGVACVGVACVGVVHVTVVVFQVAIVGCQFLVFKTQMKHACDNVIFDQRTTTGTGRHETNAAY